MTDEERVVVMAYTGITMLTGEKLGLYYQFIEQLLHRPIMTHELADERVQREIKNAARPYFLALCQEGTMGVAHKEDAMLLDKPAEWISTRDRMPEEGQVLVYMAWGGCAVAEFYGAKFYTVGGVCTLQDGVVTHWMPLPKPPKEAQKR